MSINATHDMSLFAVIMGLAAIAAITIRSCEVEKARYQCIEHAAIPGECK